MNGIINGSISKEYRNDNLIITFVADMNKDTISIAEIIRILEEEDGDILIVENNDDFMSQCYFLSPILNKAHSLGYITVYYAKKDDIPKRLNNLIRFLLLHVDYILKGEKNEIRDRDTIIKYSKNQQLIDAQKWILDKQQVTVEEIEIEF